MTESGLTEPITQPWQLEATGPATLAQVMEEEEQRVARGEVTRLRPLPTGFDPLDEVLNGGLRPGELLVIGGPFGVGKTIWGLQVARNAVHADPGAVAVYICYEHDREHLLQRLLCLESAESAGRAEALTLSALAKTTFAAADGVGLISRLRRVARYAPAVDAVQAYADRLVLVKASGDLSTLDRVRHWVEDIASSGPEKLLVVVDYLQKIPVNWGELQPETEVTTFLTQGLKEMAMTLGVRVIAIVASDRTGLKSKRMRLSDLRGSSAVQYEADVGLILNNKWAIISREHLVYNPAQAEAMRNYVVLSVEKNRAGRNTVDMEYLLDAAHFRIVSKGDFVRERLVDDKVVLA
jgi:replicative DNA helicase